MRLKILIIFFILIPTIAYNQQLSGRIIDSKTHEGVPMARVQVLDFHTQTLADLDGNFRIDGQFPTEVRLQVSSHNYTTLQVTFQQGKDSILLLDPIYFDLNEVRVTASKNELKRNAVSQVELKSIEELNTIPKSSIGQMLEHIPGVYNSSTGTGISKPVIRGLQGTRVVTLLNGVRVEGQQWGGDHGMGISSLGIGVIEVLKGPASLQYGADALGGVIYLSNEDFTRQGNHQLTIQSQFEDNTLGTTNGLVYKGSLNNLKILAGAQYANHADYRLSNKQFVSNSGWEDWSGKLSLGWHKDYWISTIRYDFSHATIGVPGHAHEEGLSKEHFLASHQQRSPVAPIQLLSNHVFSWENKFVLEKHTLSTSLAFTYNGLSEFSGEHLHHDSDEEEHEEEHEAEGHEHLEMGINTFNIPYLLAIESSLGNTLQLTYGLQGMALTQRNLKAAEDRLLPNAKQFDNGLFILLNWTLKRWRLLAGIRGDIRILSAKSDAKFTENFEKPYSGFNFSLGGNYTIHSAHVFRVNASSGYRPPHLSELLAEGEHHGAFRYEIGDKNLTTEKAIQLDLSYEYQAKHFALVLNPFINGINDYIYLHATDSSFSGLQVYQYQQATKPVVQVGADLGIHIHPHFAHFLHLESTFSYLRMMSKEHEAFSFVPQPRWSTTLITEFSMKGQFKIDHIALQHHYYLPQNQVSVHETASIDYSLFDIGIRLSYGTRHPIYLQIGARNLFNKGYINHLSRLKSYGIDNPGRTLYAKLTFNIELTKRNLSSMR